MRKYMIKKNSKKVEQIRIDFSLKREVFFVVIAAVIGAITFVIPKAIFETEMGLPYYLSWIVFGHVIGVYSSQLVIAAGIAIHIITAISIGIVVGIFLYKTGILIISFQMVCYMVFWRALPYLLSSIYQYSNSF
jgi:cell division protein FtsW (lipid II flippase)